jgi:hypothetical protein
MDLGTGKTTIYVVIFVRVAGEPDRGSVRSGPWPGVAARPLRILRPVSTVMTGEAGHAVIARVLGVGVPQLTLVSVDADTAAVAITASAAALADRNDLFAHVAGIEKDIKVSIAGPQSQNVYRRWHAAMQFNACEFGA